MQFTITVRDENVSDLASALGYLPPPLASDAEPVAPDIFIPQAVTQWLRQLLMDYQVRQVANAASARAALQPL